MKKFLIYCLSLIYASIFFVSCGKKEIDVDNGFEEQTTENSLETNEEEETTETTKLTESNYSTYLGIQTSTISCEQTQEYSYFFDLNGTKYTKIGYFREAFGCDYYSGVVKYAYYRYSEYDYMCTIKVTVVPRKNNVKFDEVCIVINNMEARYPRIYVDADGKGEIVYNITYKKRMNAPTIVSAGLYSIEGSVIIEK